MNNFIFILLVTFYSVSGDKGLQFLKSKELNGKPQCFKFSWLGPAFSEKGKNCSENIPCIKPFEVSSTPPNYTDIWLKKNKTVYGCILRQGYSCIKYTYNFNNAIVNSSYFCGKMVQDTINVVEKGCYRQKVGGYEVEACACRSKGGIDEIPCNSSVKINFSLLKIILVTLVFYFMHQNI